MSNDLPKTIARTLSTERFEEAARWWRALPAERRLVLQRLPRAPRWILAGRYVEPGEEADPDEIDLYEYLVAHELSFEDARVWHICSANPVAREAVASGRLLTDFQCPLANVACPLRALLDERPGCDVLFSPDTRASVISSRRRA